ncbi:restriction endonuclease subunit S [Burkholderia sp. LS-044]|uniref:restriction endonuclease subunit S n=1 Tax=Burkholderia sp. LS-044 TaxID=1459967 RepID=UPI0010A6123C|nr:restriction endonuclease subunit S [Burkholderia sp. LS-044]THJ48122.1 restriction endonuclease subunit S [Burkholderia sp. LS-044]
MSNKDTGAMNKESNEKRALVPRLRFPEFRGAGEWKAEPLRKLAQRCTSKNAKGEHTRVLTNSAEYGVVDQRDYFEKDIANQGNLEGYYIVEKGDYVYNPRMSTSAPVGPISKNNVGTGVMSPLYTVFRMTGSDNDFFAHYFKSTHWHHYMRQASSTGARHDRMSITNDDFMGMPLPVSTPKEQQKIADCLSSLDDLIAAESQKLGALKVHRKGLMQQLFPSVGETVPRVRFPEFRDAGEWESMPFERLVVRSFYGTSSSTSESGQYPVLRMGNMVDGGLDFSNLAYIDLDPDSFEKIRLIRGDILLNRTNSLDLVGKISMFDRDVECIAASYIVTYRLDEKQIVPAFCNLMLNTQQYQKKIKALARPSISQANINPTTFRNELVVSVPKIAEQQRIISCLSALGNLITAQSQKINALKAHKKGLMQQLFPVMAEVQA